MPQLVGSSFISEKESWPWQGPAVRHWLLSSTLPSPPPFPHSAFFKLSSSCNLSFSFSPDNDNRRKKHNYNKLDNNNNNNRKNNKLHLVIQTTCHITNKQRVKTHHIAWVSLAFSRPYRRAASVAHFWVKLQRQRTVAITWRCQGKCIIIITVSCT